MNKKLLAAAAIALLLGASLSAHRLDEYLQATLISVDKDQMHASMRLIPGVAVFPVVIASIDSNGDGVISDVEQQAYAERVLRDLSVTVNGKAVIPTLVSVKFPAIEELKEGLGEIHIEFAADLPEGGAQRQIVFENRHQSAISAYLVNCLVPQDPDIRIVAQNRNENQSFYQLDYAQSGGGSHTAPLRWRSFFAEWKGSVGFAGMFRLGMRHIAEGTDHLLFLLALLLPAPLLVARSRWTGFAGVRQSSFQILRVVSAFTIGHSITLALAALGLVHVPSRPIEVLIAVSILISAIHALKPLFPGREAVIAAFFGLIHGLAFASTLGQLGLNRWERVSSILSFNLGIEAMQLIVVAAIMPSLILVSRTRVYPVVRICGALFAGLASIGWIVQRLFDFANPVDTLVSSVSQHAIAIAVVFFATSLVCWWAADAADADIAPKQLPSAALKRI
jgi:hypothetical protein